MVVKLYRLFFQKNYLSHFNIVIFGFKITMTLYCVDFHNWVDFFTWVSRVLLHNSLELFAVCCHLTFCFVFSFRLQPSEPWLILSLGMCFIICRIVINYVQCMQVGVLPETNLRSFQSMHSSYFFVYIISIFVEYNWVRPYFWLSIIFG